ncbi:MAG: mandelate racemase/muconate lactonizing enzyme family protein [bacterium]|nr:mandelate racemase/muconate lactonizing enzyme family protein [bacterium]
MKIIQIDTMRVFVPWQDSFKEPMVQWRASMDTTPEEEDAYVIVQVHTDEGIVGIGEGGRSIEEIEKQAQGFVGKNPLEMDLFTLRRPWAHAMLDLAGKALGVPAHRLIGNGKYRDRVPVCYWSPYLPPDETARHAEEGALRGFRVHKIKARPQDVVEQVEAMTDVAGEEYRIRIDPNQLFELPATTVQIDDALREFKNVECFEDPVPKARAEWYGLLRKKCRIPIALHSSDTKLILDHVRQDGIDYVNVGGTIGSAVRAAAVAEAAGCLVWLQFEGHGYDIQAAFDAHVGAAIANASLPYDSAPFLREGSITKEGYSHSVKDGHFEVPREPGLGVTLDLEACKKYRVE